MNKKIDFRRMDYIAKVMINYYDVSKLTLDTVDYILPKYNKLISRVLYKEFRRNLRQAKRIYREVLKSEVIKKG